MRYSYLSRYLLDLPCICNQIIVRFTLLLYYKPNQFICFIKYELLIEKSKAEEDRRVEELKDKLELAVATRQEAEAKLIQAETVIKELKLNTSTEGVSISDSECDQKHIFFVLN